MGTLLPGIHLQTLDGLVALADRMLERGQSSPQLVILLATGVNTGFLIHLGFFGAKLARDCALLLELTLGRFELPAKILGRSLSSAIFHYQLIIRLSKGFKFAGDLTVVLLWLLRFILLGVKVRDRAGDLRQLWLFLRFGSFSRVLGSGQLLQLLELDFELRQHAAELLNLGFQSSFLGRMLASLTAVASAPSDVCV